MTRLYFSRTRRGQMDKKTAEVMRCIEPLGGVWIPTHGPRSRPIVPGCPDILGYFRGNPVAIECKGKNEAISSEQSEMLRRLQRQGVSTFIVRSGEEAFELLNMMEADNA